MIADTLAATEAIPGSFSTFPLSFVIFSVSCFFSSSSFPISVFISPGLRLVLRIWSTILWVALKSAWCTKDVWEHVH